MIQYVVVGKVLGMWGKNNEIKVLPLTDNPERFENLKTVFIASPGTGDGRLKEYAVERTRKHSGYYLLTFSVSCQLDLQSIKKGSLLKVHVNDVPPLEEGVYYYYQLEGLKVVTEDSSLVGVVKDIMETGGISIFVVIGEKEYLIPFIDPVIKQVDLKEKRIVIFPMEGLLE
ncbi:MAG TPA: ribosome maturation factor RimM [Thermodesulfovibrionia bacterium]|nr:ribosome maturation factor RimM [Thermodesulfovibrionia bacterium]